MTLPTLRGATPHLWQANPGACRAYCAVTVMSLLEGLGLVLTSPERTSGSAYRVINQIGDAFWVGVALLALFALLTLAPLRSTRLARYALLSGAALHLMIGGSFGASFLGEPTAGPLAPIYGLVLAFWFISQAELYRIPRAARR